VLKQLLTIVAALSCAATLAAQGKSQWVSVGSDGRLRYGTDARGNRIMDFSHAGYKGGGVSLPDVRTARTLTPMTGDNAPQIQRTSGSVYVAPGFSPASDVGDEALRRPAEAGRYVGPARCSGR
jgi:hypothetical protein